jgi:hypothetical protein
MMMTQWVFSALLVFFNGIRLAQISGKPTKIKDTLVGLECDGHGAVDHFK